MSEQMHDHYLLLVDLISNTRSDAKIYEYAIEVARFQSLYHDQWTICALNLLYTGDVLSENLWEILHRKQEEIAEGNKLLAELNKNAETKIVFGE